MAKDFPQNWQDRPAVKPREAFRILDVSESTGYRMIENGDMPSFKVGPKLRRVPTAWLRQRIEGAA